MTKVTKRDVKSIDKEIILLLKDCILKSPKRRYRRYGGGIPLTAWMAGVSPRHNRSKIEKVIEGHIRQPYANLSDCYLVIIDRIIRNKKITDIQHNLLHDHVMTYYRGKSKFDFQSVKLHEAMYLTQSFKTCREIFNICFDITNRHDLYNVPLSFILSDKLTDLILMKCLYNEVMK